jgi:protein gp37
MSRSKIEWTEATWNPVTGCDEISPGCDHCYAARMALRLQAMGVSNYRDGFNVTMHKHMLERPLRWRKPQRVFVNSMSDLFHPEVKFEFISQVFEVMQRARQHRFQVLTKRPKTMAYYFNNVATEKVPDNVWLGTSIESQDYLWRIDALREAPAKVRFLSLEPLLDSLGEFDLAGISWVIVGGESGPGARPMDEKWVLNIKRQCDDADVPFFFKQWGGVQKSRTGRELLGQTWDAMPAV